MFWKLFGDTDYEEGGRLMDTETLFHTIDDAFKPYSPIYDAIQRQWMWCDGSYFLMSKKNTKTFIRKAYRHRGQTYRRELYDCDDFTKVCLADVAIYSVGKLPRPPVIGAIDYYPKGGVGGWDVTRHACVWAAYWEDDKVGVMLYEPQDGSFSRPEDEIQETVLVYA